MPVIKTKGAGSAQGFGEFAKTGVANYIEDVFSTYLYTGNDGTLPIVNGIDLATKGGMTWLKSRTYGGGGNHQITDTARGINAIIKPNLTDATATASGDNLVSFNTNGFTLGSGFSGYSNFSGSNNVVWTFRKQAKFFDVVTYTGNGAASRSISHSLGSKPGFVVIKRTDATSDWWVAAWTGTTFRIGTDAAPFALNSTNPYNTQNGAAATSTTFDPNEVTLSASYGVTPSAANTNGGTYVAYLFASDAGGFGLTGSDNVITCGSFTTNASGNATITLGYEPQFVITKRTTSVGNWRMLDNMRGWSMTSQQVLYPNSSNAEGSSTQTTDYPYATGFSVKEQVSVDSYIYIAIRRGPMKAPTVGTSVYNAIVRNGTNAVADVTGVGFPPDLITVKNRTAGYNNNWVDKLRGALPILASDNTSAEVTDTTTAVTAFGQNGVTLGDNNIGTYGGSVNYFTANSYVNWFFKRAPSFFDEVCYTGTGVATAFTHNLGVVPELIICKKRSAVGDWYVYSAPTGNGFALFLYLNDPVTATATAWNSTTPTSTTFTLGANTQINGSGATNVAYLFATCAGVSKVGSYTGTGALLTVNCSFTTGARFILIKRTDSTGDWYVYDSARGISSGTDPYLLLNSTAAETTGTNYVDTDTTGFKVTAAAPAGLNASGGTYIFLAIA